jgi:DnaJ domain
VSPSSPHQFHHFCNVRWSSSYHQGGGGFKLDALPFSISPEEALDKFQKWCVDDQGLKYLVSWNSVRIGAAYVPIWSFDLNVRFVVTDANNNGKKRYDWKPPLFSHVYGAEQSVIHLPGLGAYAGYGFRRSLVHPIVNTTLVFMGDQTVPFEKFMLRDMKLQSTGAKLEVTPDPWNATRHAAFATLVEDLKNLSSTAEGNVDVQTEIVSSRRVYIPIYFIDYSIFGIEYRAFTSGCDKATGVSGVSHTVFGDLQPSQTMNETSLNFLSRTWAAAQQVVQTGLRTNPRGLLAVLTIALQFTVGILGRLLARIPLVAFVGGLFVGFRKIVQPWLDTRRTSADWERQREYEKTMREGTHSYGDDFIDNGNAKRYFDRNRTRILQYLGGSDAHGPSDFDWYKDWEEWARRQWQQQQQQQQQQGYSGYQQQQQQQQRRQRTQQQKKTHEYVWEFDPNDPYQVLGIRRGATKSEVSAAFRKEMLKHHPDTQAG